MLLTFHCIIQTIKQKIAQEMKKSDHGKDGENDRVRIQELQEMMSQCDEFGSKPKVLLVHTVPKSSCK